jgi:hypothetical protein
LIEFLEILIHARNIEDTIINFNYGSMINIAKRRKLKKTT